MCCCLLCCAVLCCAGALDVYAFRCEDIVEGEPAELLVLSQDDTFFNFKVGV